MSFEVMPVLSEMLALYEQPRTFERFKAYLRLLNGNNKADLQVPVLHYNPMAKQPVVEKVQELQQLGAEGLAAAVLGRLAASEGNSTEPRYQVALNVADDLLGGWTNRFTTAFANTFELGALVKRQFCTPLFWASEIYTPELVTQRTLAQVWRTRYRAQHSQPWTLAEHVAQECFVARHTPRQQDVAPASEALLRARYAEAQHATDKATLMTFFYGDEAAAQLGYSPWGNWPAFAGFELVQVLAQAEPLS